MIDNKRPFIFYVVLTTLSSHKVKPCSSGTSLKLKQKIKDLDLVPLRSFFTLKITLTTLYPIII